MSVATLLCPKSQRPHGKLKKVSTWFCLQGGGMRISDGTVFLNNCNVYSNRALSVSGHIQKASTFPLALMGNLLRVALRLFAGSRAQYIFGYSDAQLVQSLRQ